MHPKSDALRFRLAPWIIGAVTVGTLLQAVSGRAHEVRRDVTSGKAVVIRLYYADGNPFAHERYEIFGRGDTISYQVGRTDALGRVAFVPDREGEWRVRVFSKEGHGLDFTIETDEAGEVTRGQRSLFDVYGRVAAGVAVILGVFGVLMLFAGRAGRRSAG